MKTRTWMWTTVLYLFAALAMSVCMAAQNNPSQEHKPMHHHYKLVEMQPFGGPSSSLNTPGVPPGVPFSKALNGAGIEIGTGDTSIADPYCYLGSDCVVGYVFRWQNGRQSNLGVLPQDPAKGAQPACPNCAWSAFTYEIAENGAVAGESEDNAIDPLTNAPVSLAVLWKDGKIVNLGTLGGHESAAAAVSQNGDAVGAAMNTTADPFPGRCPMICDFFIFGNGTEAHAFLWRHGAMHDLGTLGGPDSAAFFVNESGQIAGTSDVDFNVNPVTGGPTVHPFLWEHGSMHDLMTDAAPGMFGGTYGISAWLNQRGQVIGTMNMTGDTTWHSFLWYRRTITDLGTLGGINTTAQWLSEDGAVVGKSDVTAICTACPPGDQRQLHHPFLWKNNVMMDLGLLYSDTAGVAHSVNTNNQVVGVTGPCTRVNGDDSCDSSIYHSFLWENGSLVDLQTLVQSDSGVMIDCPGNCSAGAYSINDRGEIAGGGMLPNGDTRAYLLIPCDEQHPGIDGCDYSLTEANPASQANPVMSAPSPNNETNAGRADWARNLRGGGSSLPGSEAAPHD